MISRMARGLTLCCGMVAALVAAPSESHALCGLFDCLFGGCRADACDGSALRRRPAAPAARRLCSPCTTTVCNYQPQTCFRAECVNVPVTTFRPVTSCDPCTGCPTTAMVPTTTFVRQVRYAPFTTFRPVCNTVAAPVMAAPAVVAPAAVAAPASGCCADDLRCSGCDRHDHHHAHGSRCDSRHARADIELSADHHHASAADRDRAKSHSAAQLQRRPQQRFLGHVDL